MDLNLLQKQVLLPIILLTLIILSKNIKNEIKISANLILKNKVKMNKILKVITIGLYK